MLDFLLDIIFPKKCVSCGCWGSFICAKCTQRIELFNQQVCPYCERPSPYGLTHPRCAKPYGLDGMFVLAHYRGPIRLAIREIKYRGTYGIISELVNLLISRYHNQYVFDYFVPIPLHPKRKLERGFNQAEKLASALTKMTTDHRLPTTAKTTVESRQWTVVNLLCRTRETRPQFDLKYKERAANVHNAFAVHSSNGFMVHGKNFCLIDDVATTGATIFECAKVLKKAGAKKVWAVCVARGG